MRARAIHQMLLGGGLSLFTGSISPSSVSGTGSSYGAISITTGAATMSTSNGIGGITYLWSVVSGSFTINNPTSNSTTFSASIGWGTTVTGVAQCVATDSLGRKTPPVTVNITIQNTSAAPPNPTVTISPTSATFGIAGSGYVTGSWTASASGGSGNYSFSWTLTTSAGDIANGSGSHATFTKYLTKGQSIGGDISFSVQDNSYGGSNTNDTNFTMQAV